MYGDSNTPPDQLFDPDAGGPPDDAWDLLFRLPNSLCACIDQVAVDGRRHELALIERWFDELAEWTGREVQRWLGLAPVADRHGEVRCVLTTVVDTRAVGERLRPHVHVYVSPVATRIRDGAPRLLGEALVAERADAVRRGFNAKVQEQTTDLFGLRWGRGPEGLIEVLEPPQDTPPGYGDVCPGPWGPRRQVVPDVEATRREFESERRVRAQRVAGVPGAGPPARAQAPGL